MAKRPFQSLQHPLTAHQVEALNSMLETLFKKTNTAASAELTGVVTVDHGGSGRASAIPWSVICGGLTTTGQHQSVSDVGTLGQILTSQGAGTLPIWDDPATPIATLDDLTDVTITFPLDGDVLTYDSGTSQWVNIPSPFVEWSVLTNGDLVAPELIFAGGDVIMTHIP